MRVLDLESEILTRNMRWYQPKYLSTRLHGRLLATMSTAKLFFCELRPGENLSEKTEIPEDSSMNAWEPQIILPELFEKNRT